MPLKSLTSSPGPPPDNRVGQTTAAAGSLLGEAAVIPLQRLGVSWTWLPWRGWAEAAATCGRKPSGCGRCSTNSWSGRGPLRDLS